MNPADSAHKSRSLIKGHEELEGQPQFETGIACGQANPTQGPLDWLHGTKVLTSTTHRTISERDPSNHRLPRLEQLKRKRDKDTGELWKSMEHQTCCPYQLAEAAEHPRNRVVAGGIHSYVLLTSHIVRSLGLSDPNDFDTFPENAVVSEWSVPRWNGIPLNDPDVVPRPFLGHFSNLLAKKPRAMFLHSPVDGRQLNLWQNVRTTINNWTPDGFKKYLIDNSKDPEPYNALPLLEDEPKLLDDMREAAAQFRRYRDLTP